MGLNVAERLVAAGIDVTVLDRAVPPPVAQEVVAGAGPGGFKAIAGDVTEAGLVREVVRGFDAMVLGAAITAGSAREATEPDAILRVNLLSHVDLLATARDAGIGRIVNLSSAAAYGEAGLREAVLREDGPLDPGNLYGITKYAAEKLDWRLGALWGLDVVSLRLSGVFGPWERATGVRDTLSPQLQIAALIEAGQPALLARPGLRDWIYAPDVADAVLTVLQAGPLAHPVYNVAPAESWTALGWGERYAGLHPGAVCRLADPDETPSVDLHAASDRAPLATERLRDELGWSARFGLSDSAEHFSGWRARHAAALGGSL